MLMSEPEVGDVNLLSPLQVLSSQIPLRAGAAHLTRVFKATSFLQSTAPKSKAMPCLVLNQRRNPFQSWRNSGCAGLLKRQNIGLRLETF